MTKNISADNSGGDCNSSAGDIKQYISIKQPGLALYRSELSHRNLDRKQLQGIDGGSHLRGHKPDHVFREVCFPAHLLLGRLHLLHPLGTVPRPCQLHAEHPGLGHTHKLRPECSDQRQQFLVDGSQSNVLCHRLAAVDLWTHTGVCMFSIHGDDTAPPRY